MTILSIRPDSDPILRRIAAPVLKLAVEDVDLIRDMIETVEDAAGLGLAAPQVGISKRIIIYRDLYDSARPWKSLVNPVIFYGTPTGVMEEGCLSVKGEYGLVHRSHSLMIIHRPNGSQEEEEYLFAEGITARIIQHEVDHLNGILFTDRVGSKDHPAAHPSVRTVL